jgi:hypothetical protein
VVNPYSPPISASAVSRQDKRVEATVPSMLLVTAAGVVVPGLPALLMRRRISGTFLLLAIPVSFLFFGPLWGLVLFAGTPYIEHGLYPFIAFAIATPVISVVQGLVLRRQMLATRASDHPNLPPANRSNAI